MQHHNQTHGHSRAGRVSKTYLAWTGMRKRCLSQNNKDFNDWGGRGITICPEWGSFEQFLKDMGEAPAGMSIDREDNGKGYSKDNCRWATRRQQQQNRRSVQNFTIGKETHCVSEWARRAGLKITTVFMRLERGWDINRALAVKIQ